MADQIFFADGSMKIMEQLFTTAIFHGPMVKDMSLLASKGVKIYAFEFGYQGSMTLADIFRLSPMKLFVNFFGRHIGTNLYQKDLGVCHGDDLFYIFPFSMFGFPKSLKNRSDKLTSQRLLTFITNFALSSNPGNVNSVEWKNLLPSADPEKFHVMKINKEVKFGVLEPNQQRRIRFWLDNIDPNGEKGSSWSQEPVNKIYHVIAERRSSILDSQQLFT